MSCILTSSMALACRDSVGGIKRIYVTELENKNSIVASAGVITTFTLITGKRFWTYDFLKETGEMTEKIQTSVENGSLHYEQEVKIRLHKIEVAKRNEFILLAKNRLMVIGLDRNGIYWLMGEANGLDLAPSDRKWGKAMGDFNGYDLSFLGKEEAPAQQVTASLITALTAPAV